VAVGWGFSRRVRRHLAGIPSELCPPGGGGVSGLVLVGVVAGWLWVENCIVDASILFSAIVAGDVRVLCPGVFGVCVSCQGRTVDALAPGADEGRGRPR
jgi:hypothetical protein